MAGATSTLQFDTGHSPAISSQWMEPTLASHPLLLRRRQSSPPGERSRVKDLCTMFLLTDWAPGHPHLLCHYHTPSASSPLCILSLVLLPGKAVAGHQRWRCRDPLERNTRRSSFNGNATQWKCMFLANSLCLQSKLKGGSSKSPFPPTDRFQAG